MIIKTSLTTEREREREALRFFSFWNPINNLWENGIATNFPHITGKSIKYQKKNKRKRRFCIRKRTFKSIDLIAIVFEILFPLHTLNLNFETQSKCKNWVASELLLRATIVLLNRIIDRINFLINLVGSKNNRGRFAMTDYQYVSRE